AIVTGGTRGIGLATVEKFLENGAAVAFCGSREDSVKKAEGELLQKYPNGKFMGIWPDLTNYESVKEQFAKVAEKFGRVDILVNNAGVSARDSLFDYKVEDFDATIALNLNAVFYCSKVAAQYMKDNGGGVILNTSSMVSIYGQPAGVAYPASKFAVNGLTKSLARELGRYGIRVNAVAPGVTRTDMVAALPKDMVERLAAPIPLARLGEPEDIANAFLFLASDMASYVTGVVLSVDGGTIN
ncbi:MAG: 3-oxoacyl-ACP reductase FabG, partial [Eubacteriaceae bacterium]|nr:3-oxoacyl-ACP reductase FabG [Eubacteriaceae bacterium]